MSGWQLVVYVATKASATVLLCSLVLAAAGALCWAAFPSLRPLWRTRVRAQWGQSGGLGALLVPLVRPALGVAVVSGMALCLCLCWAVGHAG